MSRAEKLAVLSAVEAALADPIGLVRLLQEAVDDDDAVQRVAAAFGLSPEQAVSVLDVQVRSFTPGRRARIAAELRVLRAEWGPPVEAEVRFTTNRSAVLVLDGAERRFSAGGRDAVLGLVLQHLTEQVAVPTLRPVVATVSGLPDGPLRMTVSPARDGRYDYAG